MVIMLNCTFLVKSMLSWLIIDPRGFGTNAKSVWKLSPSTPYHLKNFLKFSPQSFRLGMKVSKNAG